MLTKFQNKKNEVLFMNRMMNVHAGAYRQNEKENHSLGEWIWLLCACIGYFFSLAEVRIVSRILLGGSAFAMMLGVAGSIEHGTVAFLPGALSCVVLLGLSFLFLRGLGDEA